MFVSGPTQDVEDSNLVVVTKYCQKSTVNEMV